MVHDAGLVALWLGVLFGGLGFCVWSNARGLSAHAVRDLLHACTSVWVLGWPFWHGTAAPTAIVVGALACALAVPALAARSRAASAFMRSVTAEDEAWAGIVLYVTAYAVLTPLGLSGGSAPAAGAALFALALGDGLGGFVGRRFGRLSYPVIGGKRKTLEGSAAVAAFSAFGVWAATRWLGAPTTWDQAAAAGLVAAVVEGIAPRASDNLAVPAAVYAWLVVRPV